MKFINKKWLAPLAISLVLVGCNSQDTTKNSNTTNTDTTEKESTEETGPYTVMDDRGVEITFEEVPETIVSLQPSNTEILFELGVGGQIIGATEYDTYPEEALEIERVSTSMVINTERVIEMQPDVVFAYTSGDASPIEQLESAGLKVFVIKTAATIDDVYGDIEQMAAVLNLEEKADEIVSGIEDQIAAVQEKTASLDKKEKVYFEISPSPDIWSVGSGTFQQELIEAAGVENIYADQQSWFEVSEEDIITRNPEAIITTVNYSEDPKGEILAREGWSTISAIQNDEVYELNADILDRPGPRIGEAIELIASTIYPELFN
ncbi:ABC transporter substrate-binding protein [Ureibacillus sinduriensis]|uniref:Metal ABC transporter substrate-binding protein n=1 Tax=Ureibacillus sinduriensis BLB-1 = JCM 15800 TaxID=1384057 RepID=A0A0A3HW42_9BACL|nr:ABC transporter substrate-binding protein [Ureibacillus sinduriensis]KGR74563.1 metal ABC transporter substrate-binding protein [Ureibacillus sinduriensis BLB-1 = JCM 15800]